MKAGAGSPSGRGTRPHPRTAGKTALSRKLLRWYRRNRRDLPWRRSSDPYAILVSEMMLQQTTVKAVIPYYDRFLRRFPDWRHLSEAGEDEVLAAWSGLGYYGRARNLLKAARRVVRDYGGRLPGDPRAVRSLPGVGDYTAGAVLSIAWDLPVPALDGNTVRVLARVHGVEGDPHRAVVRRHLHDHARDLLSNGDAGDLTQALMEIGAVVCVPDAPRCADCPLEADCDARRSGRSAQIPPRPVRPVPVPVRSAAAMIRRRGRILMTRRETGPLSGMWEIPGTTGPDLEMAVRPGPAGASPLPPPAPSPRAEALRLARSLASAEPRLEVAVGAPVGQVRHTVTHRRITLTAYEGRVEGRPRHRRLRWTAPGEINDLPVAAITRKLIAAVRED